MPNALVTGAPERLPDITIALKAAGFDILSSGTPPGVDVPDLEPGSVDCYVQLPADQTPPAGGPLRRTAALIAQEALDRCDAAARLLPLLARGATVLLVVDGEGAGYEDVGRGDPDKQALSRLVRLLAEAIPPDSGPAGVRTAVVGDDRTPDELAGLAGSGPSKLQPWWVYAGVDVDLDYADWRSSILCLTSEREG